MDNKFNLIAPSGVGMVTDYQECMPSKKVLEGMMRDGFKLLVDGKKISKADALKYARKG